MKKRLVKKRAKRVADWLTREKISAAFKCEAERKAWVSAFSRKAVGQKFKFQEDLT